MYTGVMAMTAIITMFPMAIALRPRRADDCDRTAGSAARIPMWRAPRVATPGFPIVLRATTAGSGRSSSMRSRVERANNEAEKTNGPASVGTPYLSSAVPAKAARLGPTIAPTVVAHTMSER
jgi:hypothetical protein